METEIENTDRNENICPECGAVLSNPYKGEWVCLRCGYTEIEHSERPF